MSESSRPGGQSSASGEGTFDMDPCAVLVDVSRKLVDGHSMLLRSRETAEKASEMRSIDPEELQAFINVAQRYEEDWLSETLPALLASAKLALEVYDTFGPARIRIDDPTDAAIWNNKWFVWLKELGGHSD